MTHPCEASGRIRVELTAAQREAMRGINICAFAALLSPEEGAEVVDLLNAGLIADDYSGVSGFMGLRKFRITEAGLRALSPPRALADPLDAGGAL